MNEITSHLNLLEAYFYGVVPYGKGHKVIEETERVLQDFGRLTSGKPGDRVQE